MVVEDNWPKAPTATTIVISRRLMSKARGKNEQVATRLGSRQRDVRRITIADDGEKGIVKSSPHLDYYSLKER